MERESRDELAFSLDPETLDEGSEEEKAGFGTIKVVADGRCLTEGFDEHVGSYREGPLVSGYHLAEWLIWNWWRLRWEPPRPHAHRTLEWALAHRMSTIGEGYVWPNVTIDSDGFRSVPTSERSSERNSGPFRPFRYFGGPKVFVPAKCLESAIDRFASEILERLGEAELGDTNLHRLWRDLRIEREDLAVSRFRRLEALLGRDPDEADAKEIERCLADAAALGEIAALVRHGLQVARYSAMRFGVPSGAEAPRHLLLDLAHAQVPLGAVVGEGDVRMVGEQQHGGFVLLQTLPEVVGIGFGDAPALAVEPWGNRRELWLGRAAASSPSRPSPR